MKLIWSIEALNQLKKLERSIAKRIYKKVGEVAENPWRSVRNLASKDYFKTRIGDYRAILDIVEDRIEVLKVGHRKNIYKGL